jgi:hypothetical protein
VAVFQTVLKFIAFMEHKVSLQCSQEFLNQMNLRHTLPPYFLKVNFSVFLLSLPIGLFPCAFTTKRPIQNKFSELKKEKQKSMVKFPGSNKHVVCPPHLNTRGLINHKYNLKSTKREFALRNCSPVLSAMIDLRVN